MQHQLSAMKKSLKNRTAVVENSPVAHLLFEFESDFIDTLCCIPMIVRFKLDRCGMKLSLRAWNQLDRSIRENLMLLPTELPGDIDKYRAYLSSEIKKTDEAVINMGIDLTPYWLSEDAIPDPISKKAQEKNIRLKDDLWLTLNPLQRFALIKLTRAQHENMNFLPALKEFHLID